MPLQEHPLVSIGVPVYNGGQHLASSLESLISQDYPNLEILISDNASTDETRTICEAFALRDPRVRYIRQEANIGSSRNFEYVFQNTRGAFFYWHAHDDLRMPTYTSMCLEELLRNPQAVLCNSAVHIIDEEGAPRPDWHDLNFSTVGLPVLQRLHRLYDHMDWVDMMGLARREALGKALPFEGTWGGDVLISAKLLLQGDFCKVEEPLFLYRVRDVPKGSELTLKECFGEDVETPKPYTAFAEAWLRVYLDSPLDPGLKRQVFADFVKTLSHLEPQGPHPCWRDILKLEHPGIFAALPPPNFLAFLGEHLFPLAQASGIAIGRTAVEHFATTARTVLLWLPGALKEHREAAPFFAAIRKALPLARIILVCPAEALEPAQDNRDLDDLIAFDLHTFFLDRAFHLEIVNLIQTLDIDLVYCACPDVDPLIWPLVKAARPALSVAHHAEGLEDGAPSSALGPYSCLLPPTTLTASGQTMLSAFGLAPRAATGPT